MKITFANNKTIDASIVEERLSPRVVDDHVRLTVTMTTDLDVSALADVFIPEATKTITVTKDDGSSTVFEGYVVVDSIRKYCVENSYANGNNAAVDLLKVDPDKKDV